MKHTQEQLPGNKNSAQSTGPIRKPVLVLVVLVGLMAVAGVVFYLQKEPSISSPDSAANSTIPAGEEEPVLVEPNSPGSGLVPPTALTANDFAPVAMPSKAPAAVENKPPRPEPSPYTRQLVKGLTDIDLRQGPLTPEKAAEWKQNLQQLIQQGAAAVPALQEFFEKNEDIKLDTGSGTNLLGESTVRTALLKALQNISGPEALGLQAQILQTTADPREIALLAAQLEQQAPEQYRQMALDAARAALDMAAGGKLPGRDVGPLFGVLQQFGDANMVDELKRTMSNWRYYGAIALADLPNGAGIPALVEMVQDPAASPKGSRNVALQMLAQVATQSDAARAALMDQARAAAIPNSTWIEIAAILSGNKMEINGINNPNQENIQPVSGERRWHLAQGDQNFSSRPNLEKWTPDQVNQNLTLIDQLLAGNSNPLAVESLNRAKSTLQGRLTLPATQ